MVAARKQGPQASIGTLFEQKEHCWDLHKSDGHSLLKSHGQGKDHQY